MDSRDIEKVKDLMKQLGISLVETGENGYCESNVIHIPLISSEAMFLLYCMMEGWQPRRRYKRILLG